MAPHHGAAEGRVGGLEHVKAAEFFVTLRRELGQDQVALFVEEEEAILVFDQESRAVAALSPDPVVGTVVCQSRSPSLSRMQVSAPLSASHP